MSPRDLVRAAADRDRDRPALVVGAEVLTYGQLADRVGAARAALEEAGVPVTHIDENDEPLSQEAALMRVIGGQPSLFGPAFHQLTSRKRHAPDDSDEETTDS